MTKPKRKRPNQVYDPAAMLKRITHPEAVTDQEAISDPEDLRCLTCNSPYTVAFVRWIESKHDAHEQRQLDLALNLLSLIRRLKDLDEPLDQWKRAQWETWITDYEDDLAEAHAELSAKQDYDISPRDVRMGSSTNQPMTGENNVQNNDE